MSHGGPSTPAALIVRRVAETLVLRTNAEPAAGLAGFVSRLPTEPELTVVVSAPSVTRRADLCAVLSEVVIEHLGGSAVGIRLVLLGDLHAAAGVAALGRSVADQIGQEVVVPSAGFRLAVAEDEIGSGAGWLVCRPGQPIHTAPPWPPTALPPPPWPPQPTGRQDDGTPEAQFAGTVTAGRPPGATLAGRMLARARPPLVWRPPRPGPAPARDSSDLGRLPTAPEGPEGRPTAAGWSFLPGSPERRLRPVSGFVVEVPLTASGFLVAGQTTAPRRLARLIAQCREGQTHRPLVLGVAGPDVAAGAADLLFGSLAAALRGPVVVAAHPVACTATGLLSAVGGFSRWPYRAGRSRPGLRASPAAGGRRGARIALPGPVWPELPRGGRFTVARRSTPRRPALPARNRHPRPIAPALVALLTVDRWRATAAPVPAPRVSPVRPQVPVDAWRARAGPEAVPAPRPIPAPPRGPAAPTMLETRSAGAATRVVAPRPAAAAAEPEPPAARWLGADDGAATDRQGLRQALNGSYDAYVRVVTRTLAEQPGLRATGGRNDLVTGLVALRAYCVAERGLINGVLRGEPAADPVAARATRVAGCAVHGLGHLPAVFGPVFVAGPAGADPPTAYRPGDELVEPAFLDVDLVGGGSPDASVQFVIWSVSARRLTALGPGDHSGLFPPGTRFAVLAVDPRTAGSSVRVHLRELTAGYSGRAGSLGSSRPEDAEQILGRLRAAGSESPAASGARGAIGGRGASGATPGAPSAAVRVAFLPGLDRAGRRYRPPLDPVGGQPGGVVLTRSTER